MKKSLIALAVASAVSAPAFAASGNVDFYGVFDVSANMISRDNPAQRNEFSLASNNSRIGLKGAEDLGGGLSAIWQAETAIAVDAGGAFAAASPDFQSSMRNTFVGLSSKSLGTVKFGRYDTAYKMSTAKYDVFTNGVGDYNTIMGSTSFGDALFNVRETNSISYETPTYMGLTGTLTYGQRNEAGSKAINPELWSVAVNYANGPLSVVGAYEKHKDEFGATGYNTTAWKLGAGYAFGNTRIAAIYERLDDNTTPSTTNIRHNNYYVSAAHQIGNITLKGAYGVAGSTKVAGVNQKDGANHWSLGADYGLSKRTAVYALYTSLNNKANGAYTLGSGSTTGAISPSVLNQDPHGLSIGLRHSF